MPDSIVGLEYLPNVHIENITYQPFDEYQKANVTVATYDYEEKTWSSDDKFTGYFSINCFMVWQKQFIEQINSGEVQLSGISSGPNVSKTKTSFSGMEKTTVLIRGKTYTKYKKTFSFAIPQQIENLSCFSVSMIEIEDLKQNENLDLSYTNNLSYMGSLKSEKIIENNKEINDSVIFRDAENSPWSGPVHLMDTDFGDAPTIQRYMAGSEHGETPEKTLNLEVVSNFSKIRYYMPIDMLTPEFDLGLRARSIYTAPNVSSELPTNIASSTPGAGFDSNEVPDSPQANILPRVIFNREIYGTAPGLSSLSPNSQITPASSMLHQMEFVEDMNRNVSNSLVVDLESVYLSESPVAKAMYYFDREAFIEIAKSTNIKNIEVNRFPTMTGGSNRFNLSFLRTDFSQPTLIVRSDNASQTVKNKTTYKVSPREVVSVNPSLVSNSKRQKFFNGKNLSQQMLKNAQKIGSIEQLELSLPANLRAVNFIDYEVKTKGAGKYKYQIKISMKDECLLFCKDLLQELLKYSKNIENLYTAIAMKNVYTGEQFKINFLQEFYSQYDISVDLQTGMVSGEFLTEALKNSYLVKSFEALLAAEKLVGSQPIAPSLANSLNMFSTNPESILGTLEHYNNIISRFKDTYDLSDGRGTKKASSKKRKDRSVLSLKINLREPYERKMLMPIGLNFIATNTIEGTPRINFDLFNKRTNIEVKKYFPGVINSNSEEIKSLPRSIQSSFANIDQNKYSNFSPAKFIFGDKEVNTTEINPESFNADFFNTIRIVKTALKENESVESQDNLGPIQQTNLEKYTDSRDFLGDQTKFNNLVYKTLLRQPLKINSIRKKFKLLDNKILKSNVKKISLKTFDLTQPENLITKVSSIEPKSIPIQIKALSLLKTPMTNFDLNTIDFDPLSNPQTQEVFTQNYLNIGKVQYLEGFERVNGRMMMDKPIYKEIETKDVDKIKQKNLLCKIVQNSFNGLTTDSEQFNVHDKVFFMNNIKENQTNSGDTNEQS